MCHALRMWGRWLILVAPEHPGRHGPKVLDVGGLERIEECSADSSRDLKEIRFINQKPVASVGKCVPAPPPCETRVSRDRWSKQVL